MQNECSFILDKAIESRKTGLILLFTHVVICGGDRPGFPFAEALVLYLLALTGYTPTMLPSSCYIFISRYIFVDISIYIYV